MKIIYKKILIIGGAILLLILTFAYGILVGKYNYPPYGALRAIDSIRSINTTLFESAEEKDVKKYTFEAIDPDLLRVDVKSLIAIETEKDITEKRNALVKFIWGNEGFPAAKMPSEIMSDIKDDRYSSVQNLASIDRIVISMDYSLNSVVYHFNPIHRNNRLIIYHEGHGDDFVARKNIVQFFVEKGYSVLVFSMPLFGENNQLTVNIDRIGPIKLTDHERFKFFDRPIRFFVEPIAVTLNYLDKNHYKTIDMIGLSGGGWTTVLYSAIDPRISKSYPVAGSYPIFLRSERDWGDFEQTMPELYKTVNYLELYILGSYGDGRSQLQIINKYDSCCFAGVKYQTYEKLIASIISNLRKGKFSVFLDELGYEHVVSERILDVVVKNMEEDR